MNPRILCLALVLFVPPKQPLTQTGTPSATDPQRKYQQKSPPALNRRNGATSCCRANERSAIDLSEPRPVLLEDAAVHHHKNSGLAGLLCGLFMNHAFLQPDGWDLEPDGFIDHLRHKLRAAKHVYDIDLFAYPGERGYSFLSQRASYPGVHWNDAIAVRLHVGGNA